MSVVARQLKAPLFEQEADAPVRPGPLYRRVSFYELMELLSFGQLALVQGNLSSDPSAVAVGWATWQDSVPGPASWRGMEGGRQVVLVSSAQALLRSSFPRRGAQVSVEPAHGATAGEWRYVVRRQCELDEEPGAGWRVPVDLSGLLAGVVLAPDAPDRYLRLVEQQVHQRVWAPVQRAIDESSFSDLSPLVYGSSSSDTMSLLASEGGSHR